MTNSPRSFFDAAGKTHIPYADNVTLQRYVESLAKQTAQAYVNMSATTAFLRYNAAGEKVLTSLSQTYQEIIDEAITAATTSVTDYQSAMQQSDTRSCRQRTAHKIQAIGGVGRKSSRLRDWIFPQT